MNKILLFFIILLIPTNYSNAQKVRWSYKTNVGSGFGAPKTLEAGFNINSAAVKDEDEEGEIPSNRDKDIEVLEFSFTPFDAQQIVICENYNAGSILKIEIIALKDNTDKRVTKVVLNGNPSSVEGYSLSNYNFPLTKNVVEVRLYLDYKKIPGINQIAAVGLTDFTKKYLPAINIASSQTFEDSIIYMNEDITERFDPSTPIISLNGRYIYFSHQNDENINQIYRASIGENGKIAKVEYSPFNIPKENSISSVLSSISQDNNVAYVNDMTIGEPVVYKTYLKRDTEGDLQWEREKLKIKDFYSVSPYLFDCMSYDSKYYFVNMDRKDGENKYFGNDLYVGIKNNNDEFEKFIHMGYDINTTGEEIPCFLAADNKTFVFSSSGHMGYGGQDLYITKRLDDTWQNWSQPINLGNIVNTNLEEIYFTIDPKNTYAYFVRDIDNRSDLFRLEFHKAESVSINKDVALNELVKPSPMIIIQGKVYDKRTNKTLEANIIYKNLITGEVIGRATSNAETGEYTVAVPAGRFYAYLGEAENYFPMSENFDAREIYESTEIGNDLYMVPQEVGQTIQLNNIFFDTDKAILRAESDEELKSVLKIMTTNPTMEIAIAGHTDNTGTEEYNLRLSDDRAKAVRKYLLAKGIESNRITATGYGEGKPIAENDSEEGKQTNRRVEFTIMK